MHTHVALSFSLTFCRSLSLDVRERARDFFFFFLSFLFWLARERNSFFRLTVVAFETASRLFSPSDVYLRGRTGLEKSDSVTDRRQGVVIRSVVILFIVP